MVLSEAAQMKAVLEKEFQVPVRWMKKLPRNTRENAYKSFAILKKDGITAYCAGHSCLAHAQSCA